MPAMLAKQVLFLVVFVHLCLFVGRKTQNLLVINRYNFIGVTADFESDLKLMKFDLDP